MPPARGMYNMHHLACQMILPQDLFYPYIFPFALLLFPPVP